MHTCVRVCAGVKGDQLQFTSVLNIGGVLGNRKPANLGSPCVKMDIWSAALLDKSIVEEEEKKKTARKTDNLYTHHPDFCSIYNTRSYAQCLLKTLKWEIYTRENCK